MLELAKIQWNDLAAEALSSAAGSGSDLAEIAREVQVGISELWAIKDCGLLVTRLERYSTFTPELVLVAGVGQDAPRVITTFKNLARRKGWICRIHTKRSGMTRILYRLGFEYDRTEVDGYQVFKWRP